MSEEEKMEQATEETVETEEEEVDYKALYLKEKEAKEKWQSRFKSAKAQEKEKAQYEIDESYIDKKVEEKLFFQNNPTAREVEKEIKEIQSKYTWMNVQDAFDLYLAKNRPELLSTKSSNTWVEWITQDVKEEKDPSQMNDEEFNDWWKARKGR